MNLEKVKVKYFISQIMYIDKDNKNHRFDLPNHHDYKSFQPFEENFKKFTLISSYLYTSLNTPPTAYTYDISAVALQDMKSKSTSLYNQINSHIGNLHEFLDSISAVETSYFKYYNKRENLFYAENRVLVHNKVLYLPYKVAFRYDKENKPIIRATTIDDHYEIAVELLYVFK